MDQLRLDTLDDQIGWVTQPRSGDRSPMTSPPVPTVEFFRAALHALGGPSPASVVYVGDSERNDIVPARSLGLKTVRFKDSGAPSGASWLDTTTSTVADSVCDDPAALVESLRAVLDAS